MREVRKNKVGATHGLEDVKRHQEGLILEGEVWKIVMCVHVRTRQNKLSDV